jgi:hypothetical protein
MVVQVGCFVCLEGEDAGSTAETVINLVLLAFVVLCLVGFAWRRYEKKRHERPSE